MKTLQDEGLVDIASLAAKFDANTGSYPIMSARVSSRSFRYLDDGLRSIAAALDAGKIVNPVMKDLKSNLNSLFYDAWQKCIGEPYFYGRGDSTPADLQTLSWDVSVSYVHDVISATKKLEKTKVTGPAVDAMRALLAEMRPIVAAMEVLKLHVVKRVAKTDEERAAEKIFVPPKASKGATKMVQDLLTEITQKHRDKLFQSIKDTYARAIDNFVAEPDVMERSLRYVQTSAMNRFAIGKTVKSEQVRASKNDYDVRWLYQNPVKMPDWEATISAMAESETAQIVEAFIYKNLKKLSAIVEEKKDFDRVEVMESTIRLRSLSGMFKFHFADKSEFTVKNAAVFVENSYGTQFLRFPLTFHRVMLADGEQMKQASEERMNMIFVKSAPNVPVIDATPPEVLDEVVDRVADLLDKLGDQFCCANLGPTKTDYQNALEREKDGDPAVAHQGKAEIATLFCGHALAELNRSVDDMESDAGWILESNDLFAKLAPFNAGAKAVCKEIEEIQERWPEKNLPSKLAM